MTTLNFMNPSKISKSMEDPSSRRQPSFSTNPKSGKKDFSTVILERKKSANRLVVDEAINDDNSVVAMHPATMEKLQFFVVTLC
ncbi:hypothetical protein BDE02_07G072100 [Populus trichocarpa]|nr:hypothetical protein BDE02_07G072100 [Populus trichocarpa]